MTNQPRIPALTDAEAPADSAKILEQIRKGLGMVPNLHRTLAHAPVALRAYVETANTLGRGKLSPALREQIAVATAGTNGCGYCAAAHTLLGKNAGVDPEELTRNLDAQSQDPTTQAVLTFVRAFIDRRGDVQDHDLSVVREAGFGDAEIIEIVAHIAMNWFTNTFNVLARTTIDFPEVELTGARR